MHVGVDIGGTFPDIVLRLPDGTLRVSKVSSTAEDPGLAVVTGSRLRFECDTDWSSRPLW